MQRCFCGREHVPDAADAVSGTFTVLKGAFAGQAFDFQLLFCVQIEFDENRAELKKYSINSGNLAEFVVQ